MYGFQGVLAHDDALFLYSARQIAHGHSMWASAVPWGTNLSTLIMALGIGLADVWGLDFVLGVRILFFALGLCAAVMVYFLGVICFGKHSVGVLAGLAFVAFWGFGTSAMAGPSNKIPLVLFEILALVSMAGRRWFWAGSASMAAVLTWPPMGSCLITVVLVALLQNGNWRGRILSMLGIACGAGLSLAVMLALYVRDSALSLFWQDNVMFYLRYAGRDPESFMSHFLSPLAAIQDGFGTMAIAIFLGSIALIWITGTRIRRNGGSLRFLRRDNFAGVILSLVPQVGWALVDFQNYPDFFVFLPYLAVGFAALVMALIGSFVELHALGRKGFPLLTGGMCLVLLMVSGLNYGRTKSVGLVAEREWAGEFVARFGQNARILTIGVPEILVLAGYTNPTRQLNIYNGLDEYIDAVEAGGFEGWLKALKRYDPQVIVTSPWRIEAGLTYGKIKLSTRRAFQDWLEGCFEESSIGGWTVLIRREEGGTAARSVDCKGSR